jgi:hypothetical protein
LTGHLRLLIFAAGSSKPSPRSAELAWNEYISYSDPANSELRTMDAPDQYRYVLKQPSVPAEMQQPFQQVLTMLAGTVIAKTPLNV